jgi:pimeloyl-ACP methyl ester carboxylesterase
MVSGWCLATQQPARVEAMVLVSPAHYFPPQARAAMSQITVESRTEQDWKLLREWHPHGDDQIRMLLDLPVEIYEAIPRSYLWIVPNGGHGPIFGDARERFAETALAFLRGAWES